MSASFISRIHQNSIDTLIPNVTLVLSNYMIDKNTTNTFFPFPPPVMSIAAITNIFKITNGPQNNKTNNDKTLSSQLQRVNKG